MLQEVWLDCRKTINLRHVLGSKIHLYFAELQILLETDKENIAVSEQVKTSQVFIFSKSIGKSFSIISIRKIISIQKAREGKPIT